MAKDLCFCLNPRDSSQGKALSPRHFWVHDRRVSFYSAPESSGDAPDGVMLAGHRGRERLVGRFYREREHEQYQRISPSTDSAATGENEKRSNLRREEV